MGSKQQRVALVTCAEFPNLSPDDRLLIPELAGRGIHAEPVIWSDVSIRWTEFAAVVIRSCWDYFRDIASFRRWLDHLDATGVRVVNSTDVIRWNIDKSYLIQLADRGVATLPTIHFSDVTELEGALAATGWPVTVLKPRISADGHETLVASVPLDVDGRAHAVRLVSEGGGLAQPFAPEFKREGEWSLVFFDNQFSHGVRRHPAGDDFRVQSRYGGWSEADTPSAALIATAAEVLAVVRGENAYARVDGVDRGGAFLLTELELAEPSLFLDCAAEAPARFADAIVRRLKPRRTLPSSSQRYADHR
jgi:glutathione synthase/RimK-type ligase-like ATP-grasp enzyme